MGVVSARKQGTNHEDVQEMNRALVIRLIWERKICSRADLTRATGLKQSTITYIVNNLIEFGLVREIGLMDGVRGRRSIALEFRGDRHRVIAVKLSRKRILVGLYDAAGVESAVEERAIDALASPSDTIQEIIGMIKKQLESVDIRSSIIGIGFALPGPYISKEGRIALMTEFAGWEHVSIRNWLEAEFDLPVFIEHDANVGALAEWLYSHRDDSKGTLVYVAAGQGIGAGVVINGEIYAGSLGTAGEIGHTSINFDGPSCQCGNTGCLELYCSTLALAKRLRLACDQASITMLTADSSFNDVVAAYEQEDALASTLVQEAGRYLAIGLVNVVNNWNPDFIVIGDDMSQLGEPFLQHVRAEMKMKMLPSIAEHTRLQLSAFSRDSALVGAAALVITQLLFKPSRVIGAKNAIREQFNSGEQ